MANLIGYSYRKLGDYRLSQVWYERALKADPGHVLTWQYYGLWQIEQGTATRATSSEPDRGDLRHGLRGIPVTGRGARKGTRQQPCVLTLPTQFGWRIVAEAPAGQQDFINHKFASDRSGSKRAGGGPGRRVTRADKGTEC